MASADRLTRALKDAQKRVENRRCADCPEKAPNYVNIEYRTFICQNCAAVHRDLFGPSKIKSVAMAVFTTDEVKAMRAGGNEVASKVWMARWTAGDDMDEPPVGATRAEIKLFLEEKYLRKRWTADGAPQAAQPRQQQSQAPQQQESQYQSSPRQQQIQYNQRQQPQASTPAPAPAPIAMAPVPAGAKPRIQINMNKPQIGAGKKISPARGPVGTLAPPTRAIASLRLVPPPVRASAASTPTKPPAPAATMPLPPSQEIDLFGGDGNGSIDFFAAGAPPPVPAPAPPPALPGPPAPVQQGNENFFAHQNAPAAMAQPTPTAAQDTFSQQSPATMPDSNFYGTPQSTGDPFANVHTTPPPAQETFTDPFPANAQIPGNVSTNPFGEAPNVTVESTNPFESARKPGSMVIPQPAVVSTTAMSPAPVDMPPQQQTLSAGPQAGESCLLQENGKYDRVTIVSSGADGCYVRFADGSSRPVYMQNLIRLDPVPVVFAVNETAFYQVGSRIDQCTIVEVHRDAPEDDPYYTVRLQATGKQRTTDAPHLYRPASNAGISPTMQSQQAGPAHVPPPAAAAIDNDPFSELVDADVSVTANSGAAESNSAFAVDDRVDYAVKGSHTAPEAAIVLKVHYDAGTPPYYTIRLLSTGAERQTDADRLSKPYQSFMPPQQYQAQQTNTQQHQHQQMQIQQQPLPHQALSPQHETAHYQHFQQQHFPQQYQHHPASSPPAAYNPAGQSWPQQQQQQPMQSYQQQQQQPRPYGYPQQQQQQQQYPNAMPPVNSPPYGGARYPPF